MAGRTRLLRFSEGISTVSPTPATTRVANLSTYATTTAFVADKGSNASQGDVFFDSNDTKISLYDGALWKELPFVDANGTTVKNDVLTSLGTGFSMRGGPIHFYATSETTAELTDKEILCDASAGDFNINLYSAVGNKDRRINIVNAAASGLVTVRVTGGAEAVDVGTFSVYSKTTMIVPPGGNRILVANGTNWIKMGGITPFIGCMLRQNSGQLLEAAGAGEVIIYNSMQWQNIIAYNTSTGQVTCKVPGNYLCGARISSDGTVWSAGNSGEFAIRQNTTAIGKELFSAETTVNVVKTWTCYTPLRLSKDDKVDAFFDHNRSAGGLDFSVTTDIFANSFFLIWQGDL